MNASSFGVISKVAEQCIYDIVCKDGCHDEDIETIKVYEGTDDRNKMLFIDALVHACKVFKAKHVLLQKELPAVDTIKIDIDHNHKQLHPKLVITLKTFQ
jgi:hypothetical protein